MIKYLEGNCIDKIKELEDNSIDCVVSSPPYFGLRDYGVDGQFGLEKTYQDYLANTVKVFETFKPKLKDTATIWWNVGDSYNQNQSAGDRVSKYSKKQKTNQGNLGFKIESQKNLKVKDLLMIPNRVAIALQDAGWYIRSEIIWHKPNPMPESVRDRPTSCHEKIWLITKNKKYYYDAASIKEPTKTNSVNRGTFRGGGSYVNNNAFNNSNYKKPTDTGLTKKPSLLKNKRNVWTVTTKPFRGAHFATFPKDLIEPCIKAGCPEKVCVECGTPYINKPVYNYNTNIIKKNNNHGKYQNQETESTYRQGLHSNRGNKLIEVRDNLPNQRDFVKFLREKTTLKHLVENTNIKKTTIEHWFRNDEVGFAFPSVEDWNKIKDFMNDWSKQFEKLDYALTSVEYKTDSIISKTIETYEIQKNCSCNINKSKKGVVLDPFAGAGTTGLVAKENNRAAILIELNGEYLAMAKKRIEKVLI